MKKKLVEIKNVVTEREKRDQLWLEIELVHRKINLKILFTETRKDQETEKLERLKRHEG